MARSPFQGTHQPNVRPTVVTAPDALVYLNGETEVIGCPSCTRKFDIHKYITSIQVDLNVDSVPGSANISLVVPRHAIDDFYFEGVPVITPMMEVEIFAKGYYLVEGVPQYYPIFWGLVTEVTDQYSSGQHTISINCSDILKWWELCKININSAWTSQQTAHLGWSVFGNVFHGTNPYDVIWTLSQEAVGDVVVATGSLTSFNGEAKQKSTFSTAMEDMTLYWQDRFSRVRSNLMLYGMSGIAVRGDTLWSAYKSTSNKESFVSTAVRNANGGSSGANAIFDPTSDKVVAFKTNFPNVGQVNLWQSEYQTKLEIANAAKEAIGFEFYMDVTGDIVFKPPFYNLDVLPNKPVSWIQDIDIISWDFSESESEVVTQIQMSGSLYGNVDYGFPQDIEPFTSVTDWHLLRKYGWRTHTLNSEFLGDPQSMFYYGMDMLDRLNSRRHRGQVSIPLRPELRLGFPVYVAPKDQMWYVSGISHSIQFGGTAQTTLNLTARRGKFFAPRGIGQVKYKWDGSTVKTAKGKVSKPNTDAVTPYTSRQLSEGATFEVKVGQAASIPVQDLKALDDPNKPYAPLILRHPKTGRACGYPNVVMAYTRPFATVDPPNNTGTKKGQNRLTPEEEKKKLESRQAELANTVTKGIQATSEHALRIKTMQNRYMYGLNSAGVFTYLHDVGDGSPGSKPAISEAVLINAQRIKVLDDPSNPAAKDFTVKADGKHTALIRPVSDERGFEVIGHFRYGRGVSLRDGSLVYTGGVNQKAKIDLQLGLSGSLADMLAAQSQGLTTVSTVQTGSASDLATLRPEDLQTAAQHTPNMKDMSKDVEFSKGLTEGNFVDSAPLGSAAAEKLSPSVEATQLSRALTLAEMTVKYQDGSDSACACLTGRRDLTFIAQGLRVKEVIRSTSTAGATLPEPNTLLDTLKERPDVPVPREEAFPVGSPQSIADTVNKFLYGLYSALDKPHQALEATLRGAPPTPGDTNVALYGNQEPPYTMYDPPFNAPERYNVQDLESIERQFESNAQALTGAWDQLRSNLQREPVLAGLRTRMEQLDAEARRIQESLTRMDPLSPDARAAQERLDEIAREKARLELEMQQVSSGGEVTPQIVASSESASTSISSSVSYSNTALGSTVKKWGSV